MMKRYVFAFLSVPLVLPAYVASLPARAIEITPSDGSAYVQHVGGPISQNLGNAGLSPDIWSGYALLKRICAAESNYGPDNEPRQFLPDGSVLWGWENGVIVRRDSGACQINTWMWGATAAKMGLDLVNSEQDNITFAKWLYDRYGWHPWIASKPHWDPEGLVK